MSNKKYNQNQALIFANRDLESPEHHVLEQGQAIVYSHCNIKHYSMNEDSAAVFNLNNNHTLLVVADGLGGHSDGAKASRQAIQHLKQTITKLDTQHDDLQAAIMNSLESSNETIQKWRNGAATTISIAEIKQGNVRTFHAGDSEVLLCGSKGRLGFKTISHSPVGYAQESGMLTEDEAMIHPDRHLISNFLGSKSMHIDTSSFIKMKIKDTLLLATDGVFDNLTKSEIIDIIRKGNLNSVAQELMNILHFRMSHVDEIIFSKPDDMTFILYRLS